MEAPDLLMICVSAFTGVFVLLTLLALVMRALIIVFPERDAGPDAAVLAAIAAAAAAAFPGTKLSKVEESK